MIDPIISEYDEDSEEWEIVHDPRSMKELIRQIAPAEPDEPEGDPPANSD